MIHFVDLPPLGYYLSFGKTDIYFLNNTWVFVGESAYFVSFVSSSPVWIKGEKILHFSLGGISFTRISV